MKNLYLLRHALAERSKGLGEDFDRPLAPQGREAAARVAEAMRADDLIPEWVLCSGARRALETWDVVAPRLTFGGPETIPMELRHDLYLASCGGLLGALKGLPDALESVLLVGHNPGIHQLAVALSGPRSRAAALRALRHGTPSAALAVLTFASERWADMGPNGGRLERVVRPADLAAERVAAARGARR